MHGVAKAHRSNIVHGCLDVVLPKGSCVGGLGLQYGAGRWGAFKRGSLLGGPLVAGGVHLGRTVGFQLLWLSPSPCDLCLTCHDMTQPRGSLPGLRQCHRMLPGLSNPLCCQVSLPRVFCYNNKKWADILSEVILRSPRTLDVYKIVCVCVCACTRACSHICTLFSCGKCNIHQRDIWLPKLQSLPWWLSTATGSNKIERRNPWKNKGTGFLRERKDSFLELRFIHWAHMGLLHVQE